MTIAASIGAVKALMPDRGAGQATGSNDVREAVDYRDAKIDRLAARLAVLEQLVAGQESGSAQSRSINQAPGPAWARSSAGASSYWTASAAPGALVSEAAVAEPQSDTRAPPAAPGQVEIVDEDEIERALERTLVSAGVLLLPAGTAEIQPTISYAHSARRNGTLVNINGGTMAVAADEVRRNEVVAEFSFRLGLPLDAQLELGLPVSYVDQSTVVSLAGTPLGEFSDSALAVGDVGVALAKTLLRESGWRPDVVGRIAWNSNSGQKSRNRVLLGSGFHEVSGSLSFLKRQDPLAFVADVGYETSLESNGYDPGDQFTMSVGAVLAASPETSLRFVFDQSFVSDVRLNGVALTGSDGVVAMLTVGASSVLGDGVLLDLSAGMGLTADSPDYFIRAALPVRLDTPLRQILNKWNM
ncbi:MAG: hypothetical protein IPM60_02110 [Rhodospirillales bacterium]|nr:hypothetical protein [Rhodospirillales bacterium]